MKIIAHRSGTGVYPEQTIAAAAKSLEQGADYVEMDIRYTSDKVPVICHDTSALRIFGKNSDIDSLPLQNFFHSAMSATEGILPTVWMMS